MESTALISPRTPGARLRRWRQIEGITLEEAAARFNEVLQRTATERRADLTYLSRLERDLDTPSLALATAIERVTGIVASSWVAVA
jgi:transcriptional regulator with XRE-family HTH domain